MIKILELFAPAHVMIKIFYICGVHLLAGAVKEDYGRWGM
jgi:hypothetical protein